MPLELDNIIASGNFKLICLSPLDIERMVSEEKRESAISERITDGVSQYLSANIKLGIKMAILDDVLPMLTGTEIENFLNFVRGMNLDQVIFTSKYPDQASSLMRDPKDTLQIDLGARKKLET